MILSSPLCSIDACERSVLVICECHNEHFCNDHFIEHTMQLDTTATNKDQSKTIKLNKRSCFHTLNQWWKNLYQIVRYSSSESKHETVSPQSIELTTVTTIEVQEDKNKLKKQRHNLFPFKEPYQTLQTIEKKSISMACSDKYLLIEYKANLCLFDRTLNIIKQIPWSYTYVNICWTSTLNQFILVTHKNIFILDETILELKEYSIPHHNEKDWSCAACSDTILYLSTMDMAAYLYEYTLLPSIEFIQERQISVMCSIYESILTFNYGNERLIFVICNAQTFQNRLELHSSLTFEILWTIPLNILTRCCSIRNDQWIIINYLESQLLHLSSDGTILQDYKQISLSNNPIINAIQWAPNTIVTVTMKNLNLHKFTTSSLPDLPRTKMYFNEIQVLPNDNLHQVTTLNTLNSWCSNICRRVNTNNDTMNQQEETNLNTLVQTYRSKNTTEKLFPLKRPFRTIKITDKTSVSLACNDKHILLKQTPYLCLFNRQLMIIKEIPWPYEHVNTCWSSTLERFILITDQKIFTLDDNTIILDHCQISSNDQILWRNGACSTSNLFLSTGDICVSLQQYTLQPLIQFVKTWHVTGLHPQNEGILTFICTNDKLAFVISNIYVFRRRFEVHSLLTYERLWSISLEAVAHCCSIYNDQWIIMELLKPRLLHLSIDGKILQEYQTKPLATDIIWNAVQLDQDTIVTLTMTSLNLHKLS
ncbi:hypothetical protein I4U23_001311 [Adineta vaga]|nr:hypothetical protein I4U23_001311 [Adineta vaga]